MVQVGSRWVALVFLLAPLSPMPATADPVTIAVMGGHLTSEPLSTFAQFQLLQ